MIQLRIGAKVIGEIGRLGFFTTLKGWYLSVFGDIGKLGFRHFEWRRFDVYRTNMAAKFYDVIYTFETAKIF